MKHFLAALTWGIFAFAAIAMTGCAGLNVSWSVVATYNTPHATPGEPVAAKKDAQK